MAPIAWTIPEQAEFLTGQYPKYLEHTADKSYHRFWANLYTEWFTRWPERVALFPDTEGALSVEQGEALGAAVDARKKQLRTWFRWRANASPRNRLQQKKSTVFEKVLTLKGSHIRTPTELYMLEHYDDRIKPRITAEQSAGNVPAFGNNLAVVRKYAQGLLESEDSEIKDKIKLMYEMQEKNSKATYNSDSEEETDPAEIKRRVAIDDLPYALARVAKLVKRRTRFAISFVCAGPDPSRKWDIGSISCHPDATPEGHTFSSLFPKESNAMLVAFQEYAETLFPPESRDPTKTALEGNGGEVEEDSVANEGMSGVLQVDEGYDDGIVPIEDSGDGMENPQTKEGDGPEYDKGANNVEHEEIGDGGEGYGASIIQGDEWQATSDASQPFAGLDASFGTWAPSGTAGSSLLDQSMIQFNASQDPAAIDFQSHFGIDLASQAASNISFPTFASGSSHVSGNSSYNPINNLSFSAGAIGEIATDFSGHNWNFSGIGMHSLGTLPLSDLRSTQFGNAVPSLDVEVLPLPSIPNNPSPVRPRLPAVPPSSPPDEQATATLQQKPAKSRPQAKAKGCVAPPKRQPAPPLEKSTAKSRPRPKAKQKAAVLPERQPAGDRGAQDHPHPVPSTDTTVSQQTVCTPQEGLVTEQPRVSAPSETRTSKRVPVQSKWNAIADAIGTNRPTFVNDENGQGGEERHELPTSPKKGKRSGESTEKAKKRKKVN